MKPAPALPKCPIPVNPLPYGAIMSPNAYAELGEQARHLGIRVAVDYTSPSDLCDWYFAREDFDILTAELIRP